MASALALPFPVLAAESPARAPFPTPTPYPETAAQREARLKRWRDARFGMFIHWGIYSVLGRGEWVQYTEQIPQEEYAKLADQFRPTSGGADEWAATARSAGMKYMVFTARHHDGFAMFDTKAGRYSSAGTGLRRDYVASFAQAARKAGMLVGLYYSPLDWRFPGFFFPDMYRDSAEAMRAQFHTQMEELMSNYGKIDILWFDGGEADWLNFGGDWVKPAGWRKRDKGEPYRGGFDWQPQPVFTRMRDRQPQIVINDRANMPEDFKSREGERSLGEFDADRPWELCVTLAGAWGWQPNKEAKPVAHWIRLLASVAGRDGNLLLNVGPWPDGRIDPPQVERLREIGAWLTDHGESIYGTRGGPFLPGEYGVSTHRDNVIYVHVFKWPGPTLRLPGIPAAVVRASLVPERQMTFTQSEAEIVLNAPAAGGETSHAVIKLELDRAVSGLAPRPVTSP